VRQNALTTVLQVGDGDVHREPEVLDALGPQVGVQEGRDAR
jgi:hypothetical protein